MRFLFYFNMQLLKRFVHQCFSGFKKSIQRKVNNETEKITG